jgi:hypothetical protein
MSRHWFVEVLARNGEVRQRHRVEELPIRLGRAYDNDFILDDPHAAAHHAIVESTEDGSLQIRDLGSQNGIIHRGQRRSDMALDGHQVVRLGHTNLRIRASDFPVDAEVADTTLHSWEGARPALLGLLLIILLSASDTWLLDTEKFQAIHYLLAMIYLLGAALAWSGLWALANRVFGGHPRFGRHLFILACGLLAIQFWAAGSDILAFAMSLEVLTRYGAIVSIAITATMLFFHLYTINPQRVRRFGATCALLALLVSGIVTMNNYQSTGHTGSELYMHVLLPPEFRLSKDKPVAQFITDAASLKTKVDAERGKTVNGEAIDADEND